MCWTQIFTFQSEPQSRIAWLGPNLDWALFLTIYQTHITIGFARYETAVEKAPKTIIVPRYEPVFVGANLKEYETQVLQMSVPIDSDNDESFRKKKARSTKLDFFPSFHLDNISYITKDRTSKQAKTTFFKMFNRTLISKKNNL